MRKLIMKMSITVDGFVAGPDGEKDWLFRSSDETSRTWLAERNREAGLIIMGRKSFEDMAPYWPAATGPFAAPMNEIPKAVFTRKGFNVALPNAEKSSASASWSEALVVDGDLAEEITKLKSQPGKPIWAIGGAEFIRNLIQTGLVDEYLLITHPVILGKGLEIFNGLKQPADLKLTDTRSFPGGIVANTYCTV